MSMAALGGGGLGGKFGDAMIPRQFGMGQQGGNGSSGSTTQQGSTSGSSDPLKTDFQKLKGDIEAIQAKSQVTVAELAAVRVDFQKIQSGATTKPDQAKVTTLTDDIKALNGQLPTAAQTTQLQADYTAVLQSQGITDQTLITRTITDINAVVQSANVTAADLATLAADQAAIKKDMGSNAPSGSTGAPSGLPFPDGSMAVGFGRGPMRDRSGNGWSGGRAGNGPMGGDPGTSWMGTSWMN